jgi:3-oxoacyl-ACP reductase-like protein
MNSSMVSFATSVYSRLPKRTWPCEAGKVVDVSVGVVILVEAPAKAQGSDSAMHAWVFASDAAIQAARIHAHVNTSASRSGSCPAPASFEIKITLLLTSKGQLKLTLAAR